MADFEFFKKQFEFVGKHARMVSELCVSNDYEHTYFKRYIDVYIFAAIIGIRIDRKASRDYSPVETKSILPEQMINACLLYTSPSPRDLSTSRMPSSA